MHPESSDSTTAPQGEIFATTRWTVVLAAGKNQPAQGAQALEELCQTYWYPLYAYVRRRGYSKEDAEDLTQAFFERFLEKNYIDQVNSQKGKFRAFLLAALKHFLANDWDRNHRQKRGGNQIILPLELGEADSRFQHDPPDHLSPDKLYDREWAITLLETVIQKLRDENSSGEKGRLFEHLKPFLMVGSQAVPYPQVASGLSMTEGAVRVAVHRLRGRYRELLRAEIAQTLSAPHEIDEEMRALLGAFSD